MTEEQDFQKQLRKAILGVDSSKLNRKSLLEDIFKTGVAKLFEYNLGRKGKDRLELDALIQIKKNLINEFRSAKLGEYQQSEKWYEDLFENTVKEIFEEAARNHNGINQATINQTLQINQKAYINEGGLYIPDHIKQP